VSSLPAFALGKLPRPERGSTVLIAVARPDLRRVQDAGLVALFVALTFVVLFWQLGTPTFWDPDEAHYAETTHEMLATGDWWAPFYNDQPFFDKPVLFHQLQGLAMLVLGPTELAARIVPATAALGLVLVTFWFGARIGTRDTGIVAALLLIASPAVFALARYAILDTLFTVFLFGGAALLAIAALEDRPRLQWAGYVALALSVGVKGPVALILCGLAFVLAIACSSDLRRRLLGLHWVLGLGLVLVLSSPWFVYMYVRFGDRFVDGYVLDENIRLYANRRFANQPNFYFYFQILATGLLPWTGLLIGRLYDDVRAAINGERLDSVEILLWAWTAAVVGFFTFSTFKLDHYVFPAAPALCLLCARAWFDVRTARLSPRNAGSRIGLHLIGPLVVAIGLGCGYFLIARLALPPAAIVVPIALTFAGAMLTALANVRGGLPPRAPWIVLSALLVTYAGLVGFVLPALEEKKVVDDLARDLVSDSAGAERVATFRLDRWNPAFRFYVGRHVTFLTEIVEAETYFRSAGPFYCVMRQPAFDEFVARGVPLERVRERDGMWATSGRSLWRRRIPTTRFVLVRSAGPASAPR
jgi:4-amino-4-deoxy-L-arabinose transferase-like glycosyltransferase